MEPNTSFTEDERYRLLIEAVTDYAIYMLDPTGIVSSWNPGAERIKGYVANEIIGQHFSRFYTEEDRKNGLPERALRTARLEGKFDSEGWRVRKDGGWFWAAVVIDPIWSPSGELLAYAKITRDLTKRKDAERQLKLSEEQFRLLVQGVVDYAIYMIDTEGNVTNWNLGAQRIKGYAPGEIIGRQSGDTMNARAEQVTAQPENRSPDDAPKALKTKNRQGARLFAPASTAAKARSKATKRPKKTIAPP
jgi:PAS domain S-box-containing protein